MKIDLEQMKAMKELFSNDHVGQIVPLHRQTPDKDSFSVFTSGLRENWIFVMAIFAFSLWLLQNINTVTATNDSQDRQIQTNVADISQLQVDLDQTEKNIQTLNNIQTANYNDLVRRLDSLQSSIDAVKKE